MKKTLLIGPYPPLFSYGGPTRSVFGLHKTLSSKKIDSYVLSPNTHLNGEILTEMNHDKKVIYSGSSYRFLLSNFKNYDIIWLNSFFELKLFFLIFLNLFSPFKLIVSPRGQLSSRAISSSNPFLKNIFIKLVFLFRKNLIFHSTSNDEKEKILFFFPKSINKKLQNIFQLDFSINNSFSKKFVFYSRIHKKKGLHILLDFLIKTELEISLDIYGFIEDKSYWIECQQKINKLPNVNYLGQIDGGEINKLKDKYTFFILPTLNENYGHVIIELISLGIIPILSKGTTPFDDLITKHVGLNFDIKKMQSLHKVLSSINIMSKEEIITLKLSTNRIFNIVNDELIAVKKEYVSFVTNLLK